MPRPPGMLAKYALLRYADAVRLRPTAAMFLLLSGCEIFAGFDRDRIRPDEPDVTTLFTGDGQVLGGGRDAAVRDGGLFDGATVPPDEDATVDDADLGDAATDDPDADLDASDLDGGDPDGGDLDAGDADLDGDVTDGALDPDAAGDAS